MASGTSEYLFLPAVAEICGVSLDTVRHWIQSGSLPSVRPGRRRMVLRAELDRFLARGAKASGDATTTPRE
jgi:excisionase family DNA binding protein